jgi:hypothetical protein
MAVQTELRQAPFDANLKTNIDSFSNSAALQGYTLVSCFLAPIVGGVATVILVFQKRS